MKKLSLISFLFISVGFVNAQSIVCGKISHPKGKIVKLNYYDGDEKIIETTMQKDGSFRLVSTITTPQEFSLETSDETTALFLYPGDSVYVTIDTKAFDETVVYRGKGAIANNFLAKQYLHFEKNIGSRDFMQQYYRKMALSDAPVFCAYADSIVKLKLDYLQSFKEKLPEKFYDYQFAEIVYAAANDKIDYPSMHFYLQGIQDSSVAVDPPYFDFYQTLSTTNENYLASDAFCTFINKYIYYRAQTQLKRDTITEMDRVNLSKSVLIGKIKEMAISDIILMTISYAKADKAEEMYQLSKKEITDPLLLTSIENLYQRKSKLFPGNVAPAISLKTKEGKLVNLADFKGKVVYLDFWASWCGPCMMEMPSAKKLQDTFASKDVVFLYVSIDEDENAWKKTIDAKKMKGVHIRAKGFDNEVVKKYNINGVPTYFLIGRDGKIIDNNPSRPSGLNVVSEIEEALKL